MSELGDFWKQGKKKASIWNFKGLKLRMNSQNVSEFSEEQIVDQLSSVAADLQVEEAITGSVLDIFSRTPLNYSWNLLKRS